MTPGWSRVQAIVDFAHERLKFGYQHARATRTAAEAIDERVGVCRDFAHLTIALCRCLNIPARYVNGYLGDIGVPRDPAPMDFSAWCEMILADAGTRSTPGITCVVFGVCPGARPRRDGRAVDLHVRRAHPEVVQGMDRRGAGCRTEVVCGLATDCLDTTTRIRGAPDKTSIQSGLRPDR